MNYKVSKNHGGFFEFKSIDNDRFFLNTTVENINENIDLLNAQILENQKHLEIIEYMNENKINEYHSYIHGVWHDTGSTIKVVLTHEQNTILIKDYPELLTHVLNEENDILYMIENGFVYIYFNYFLEGHKELLLMYGAIIFDNNEITTEEPNE